ncbi:Spo0B domain-containing protein [Paenibacillus sp. P26]|nr:Spo0B domain-containing protein [Paenibacillus sp. P26]
MTSDANGLTRNADPEQGLQPLSAGGGKRDEVDPDGRVLRLFNHYRHDWMNDIQILFGYVKLKKYDKLLDLMEKINEKVRQESYISKLGLPSLIVRLLSFQAEVKEPQLVLRMDEEIRMQDMKHADQAAEFLLAILECFRCEAKIFRMRMCSS